MTISITQLFAPAALTTGAVTYYTVPATPTSSTLINGMVRFTNVTAGAVTVTAYAVQAAGTADDSNAFMKAESLGANSHIDVPVPMLGAGGFLQALAGAGTSITISALNGVVFS